MLKTKGNIKWAALYGAVVILVYSFTWQQDTPLSEAEKKGRQIFMGGTSPDGGEVFALLSGIKVPASVLACASCHGKDGTGREEGGVSPSNITWAALTTTYEGSRKSDRTHPPYDDRSLKRAITMGLDPAGNTLNATMPKYQMSHEDLSNLVAYLKVLGMETSAGVGGDLLHIGMFPSFNPGASELNGAVEGVVEAYFSEINEHGGIYGRQLQLHVPEVDGAISEKENLNRFLEDRPVFALVSSYHTNLLEQGAVPADLPPVIGALDQLPVKDFTRNRHLFYLYPGLDGLTKGLANFAKEKSNGKTPAVIYQADGIRENLALALEEGSGRQIKMIPVGPGPTSMQDIVDQLEIAGVETLFVLLPAQLERALFASLEQSDRLPELFLLGNLTQVDLLSLAPVFNEKIFLAYPTWLTSTSEKGRDYYHFLSQKHQLSARYQQGQLAALASAMLLVEALEKEGRKLSRHSLIGQLEKMYSFDTGLGPPLTYGPNRRVGSDRVFIAKLKAAQPRLELVKEVGGQ